MSSTVTPRTDKDARTCPLCGGNNDCATARGGRFDVDCWCASELFPAGLLDRAAASPVRGCICRRCAKRAQHGSLEQVMGVGTNNRYSRNAAKSAKKTRESI